MPYSAYNPAALNQSVSYLGQRRLASNLRRSMMLQVHVGSESMQPAASQSGLGSKPAKRMPAPTVPAEVKHAVAIFKPYFDPALFPKVSLHVLPEL